MFGQDLSCPLPLYEDISQVQRRVCPERDSQLTQHRYCHLSGERCREGCVSPALAISLLPLCYFLSHWYSEHRFSLLSPAEPMQLAKHNLCLVLGPRGGRGWGVLAADTEQKGNPGGPCTPSAVIQPLKLLSLCFGDFLRRCGLPGST